MVFVEVKYIVLKLWFSLIGGLFCFHVLVYKDDGLLPDMCPYPLEVLIACSIFLMVYPLPLKIYAYYIWMYKKLINALQTSRE